ncbi:DUF389 domain-containing protein [Nonomuraea phyllanthi]|uniref:DUF389 domain-containing protein n=1 Tax=Nonomuraea phyllanthi TaxID=2219224 RepID=A0A5C4WWT7_9ACTN|nr:DUF389 domain-containing protein [Nonomuraea phyllanthi]KAB8197907.1 DUF389 domain-containing protein [Nonomuraea phyllanthi]QFY06109.1 DUF389 domain-containing protein [Nonomuraea phyllanthi]
MLHLRLISPAARTEDAAAVLEDCAGVTNIVVIPGAAREPAGDVIMCDAARESANEVLGRLQWLETEGSIAIEEIDLSLSKVADHAVEEAPGEPDDAVVWEELAQRVQSESRITWAYLTFLAIATQLAGIGVLQNSPILIVGAMVLGPEFGAVAAICFGLLHRRGHLVVTAFRTLVVGFALAIAITFACALVSTWLGWIDLGNLARNQEVRFIVTPDRWSFIVALLAGAAGVLSITAGKSSALVGVFISVTTVPAAGYVAVALALGDWKEVSGSVSQLAVNVAGMVIAGTCTLLVQRRFWPQVGRRSSV